MQHAIFTAGAGDRTQALQAALDALAAQGGGQLTLGPGVHSCGGLRLGSNLHLHLAEGAVLRALPDYAAYASCVSRVTCEDSDRAFLFAANAHALRITGPGVIEGQGRLWTSGFDAESGTLTPVAHRPRMLVIEDCTDVVIDGVQIREAPMWTVHLVGSRGVTLRGVTVRNDMAQPNTDGIAVDGCADVLIEDCDIAVADDSVVLKTSTHTPCERITVRGVRTRSRGCSFKIGTESHGDFRDILFEACDATETTRGLGIFSRDGGTVERVIFRDIRLNCREAPVGYWGTGEAISLTVVDRRPGARPAGPIRDVRIEDVTGTMQGAINLVSTGDDPRIHGISMARVRLEQSLGEWGHGQNCDLRPTPADLAPADGLTGRANAWFKGTDGRIVGYHLYPGGMPGIYVQNAEGLRLSDVRIARQTPLPGGWSADDLVIVGSGFGPDTTKDPAPPVPA